MLNKVIVTGVLILLSVMNSTASFTQTASAFSLQGAFNKLFGGLIHKSTTTPKQTQANTNATSPVSTSSSSPSLSSLEAPTACHIIDGALPDPKCTPGAANPSVTQDNIKDTICVPGFSKTVRPPVSYTTPLKINLMRAYGFTDSRSNYELDHLISLEIGGNPTEVRNLWPEPGYGQNNFHVKDRFENYLHNAVCSGSMSLSQAQKEIAADWLTNWKNAGMP